MEIKILQSVLKANNQKAEELRKDLKAQKTLMLNFISSPGSGKTTILENILPILSKDYHVAVIEGDVETDKDYARLKKFDLPIALINTQGACHLESVSIEKALNDLPKMAYDLVIVENVGNLVCPAEFDIGEDAKVAVLSTPEGEDKVLKYPLLFREASLVILNKLDLLAYTGFNRDQFYADLKKVNPTVPVIELSCKTREGLDQLVDWFRARIQAKRSQN